MEVVCFLYAIQTDAFDGTDVAEGMLKTRLVCVNHHPTYTHGVVVNHGQESPEVLAHSRLVVNEVHRRLPKVQHQDCGGYGVGGIDPLTGRFTSI